MDFNMYKILAVYGLILLATIAFAVNKGVLPWFNLTDKNYPSVFLVLIIFTVGIIFWAV